MKPLCSRYSALAALLLLPSLASAQSSPTEGIALPDRSLSTQTDAASVETNPAGLGYIESPELSYTLQLAAPSLQGTLPEGHAVFAAIGGGGMGLGLGLQWLTRPDQPAGMRRYRKYSLGGAISNSENFSVGLTYNLFGADRDERLDALATIDLGAQLRLSEHVGVGLFMRDANTPYLYRDNVALPRRFAADLAVRLWTGRLILDQEIAYVQGRQQWQIIPRLVIEPVDGLRVFGRARFDTGAEQRMPQFQELIAGLEVSLGFLGVASAAQLGRADGDARLIGHAHTVWLSNEKQRSIIEAPSRWQIIDLTSSFADLPVSGLFGPSSQSFVTMLLRLDEMARDNAVRGVVINLASPGLGYAQAWELRQRIAALRAADKKVVALMQSADTRDVFIASAADAIFMVPQALYEPTGVSAQLVSYQGILQKLGVEAEFLRVRDYKTAPEAFVSPTPSPESLEQTGDYLAQLYSAIIGAISAGRDRSEAQVRTVMDNLPLMPHQAAELGLIDGVLYPDELERKLRELTGTFVSLQRDYNPKRTNEERWETLPVIAVLVVDGTIIQGSSGQDILGSEAFSGGSTLTRAIDDLRRDSNVRAVIVRINSPGGSAYASEQIYRELRRLAQVKPVVASMGNIAASGGYYVAVGADTIFATPLTLTGSIGIFAGKFSASAGLRERLGLNVTTLQEGRLAGAATLLIPYSQAQREAMSRGLLYLYDLFLQQAAATRPLSASQLDEVARGRVWTGEDAAERQLVDQQGGLIDALRHAERLAALSPEDAKVVIYPRSSPLIPIPGIQALADATAAQLAAYQSTPLKPLIATAAPLMRVLSGLERSALVLLRYEDGEALMLPPVGLDIR